MNIALWATQILLVLVFGYSALIKGTQSTERAVELGMTGVVNVPLPVMRLAAYCEVLGVIGLIVPYVTGVLLILTPMAAIGLGVIMVLAARIHLGLGEPATAVGNLVLLAMCPSWRGAGGRDECARTPPGGGRDLAARPSRPALSPARRGVRVAAP
jgi:hypothetical protein